MHSEEHSEIESQYFDWSSPPSYSTNLVSVNDADASASSGEYTSTDESFNSLTTTTVNLDFNDLQYSSESSIDSEIEELEFNDFSDSSHLHKSSSSLFTYTCCESRCIASLSMLQLEEVQTHFTNLKTRCEQRQYLLDVVSASAKRTNSGVIIDSYTVGGTKLCKKAFLAILGISHKRLRMVTRLLNAGATLARSTLCVSRRKQTQRLKNARAWLSSYVKRIGERMPHTQQIHLPSFLTKMAVYDMMVTELMEQGLLKDEIISLSHFYGMWAAEFPNCTIPKVCVYTQYYNIYRSNSILLQLCCPSIWYWHCHPYIIAACFPLCFTKIFGCSWD